MCDLGVNGAHLLSFFKLNKIEDGRSKRANIKKYMKFICGVLVFSFREKKIMSNVPLEIEIIQYRNTGIIVEVREVSREIS